MCIIKNTRIKLPIASPTQSLAKYDGVVWPGKKPCSSTPLRA